jgi:hypothetical protein
VYESGSGCPSVLTHCCVECELSVACVCTMCGAHAQSAPQHSLHESACSRPRRRFVVPTRCVALGPLGECKHHTSHTPSDAQRKVHPLTPRSPLLNRPPSSPQDGYTSCLNKCTADETCKSWDWDATTGACDLRQQPYPEQDVAGQVGGAPPPPPNPALEKLIAKYGALQNATCAKVVTHVPTLVAGDAAVFMAAYAAFNGSGSEDAVWVAARKLITPEVDTFLSLPDSVSSADGLDANMVLCAVLADAATGGGGSPKGGTGANALANYAVQGAAEEAIVDQLLANAPLMRDMLVAGGASGGKYGEAAAIYAQLHKASGGAWDLGVGSAGSPPAPPPGPPLPPCPALAPGAAWDDREPANVLKRLALGVAVTLAVPIQHRYAKDLPNSSQFVDPVGRYTHFAEAYAAGDLDPAFPILTAFELAHAVDGDATDEDQAWLRRTLANYLPNEVSMSYSWRFCESVHSDVQ